MPEDIRIEWNIEGFHELRDMYADECESLGEQIADHCNAAAESHNTDPSRPSGTYDVMSRHNAMRPVTYVRTADARGDLDNMLHSTLAEGLYAAKGKVFRR